MKPIFTIVAVIFGVLVVVPVVIARGWLLSTAWGWLAVPAFNAPPLSIPQAIAIGVLYGVVKGTDTNKPEPEKKKGIGEQLAVFVAWYVLTLLFAYVLRGFL